jgi:CRP-like cAMP-binding protein
MIDSFLLKLRKRDTVSAEEEMALRERMYDIDEIPARQTVMRRGEPLNRSVLLLEGLMCRYKDLRDGQRQITALHISGDFLDLHGFTLKRLDHDVMSLAPSRIAYVRHDALKDITERYPHLTRLLWFSTNLDAAMHREWELSLGRRVGAARAAQLFCEMYTRYQIIGRTDGPTFALPINQSELGECLGLTVVHTNRVLRELRERGLVDFARGQVTIRDLEGLKAFAEFDPAYLYLDPIPL